MSWNSASLFKSSDGQAYDFSKLLPAAASIGYATTALPTTTRWPSWDAVNTVTIQMKNGATLASAADDLTVLNGGNAALLGSELIQFVNVTDLGDGLYSLDRLLRGRNGTNLQVGTHVAGEVFVLLSRTAINRVLMNTAEIGSTRYFKAVSGGGTVEGTAAQPLVFTCAALKPWTVCSVAGTRDGSNNLTLTWIRRTRHGGAWRDYVDVALNETTEGYEVDIMNGSTVVRTLTSVTATAPYTAAQQVTDFGSTQASLTVKIYQLSVLIGRGYAATATV